MIPSCYNHPQFEEKVVSLEFKMEYEFRGTLSCGHWTPLGNAFVRPFGDNPGGKTFDWKECEGCKWKEQK